MTEHRARHRRCRQRFMTCGARQHNALRLAIPYPLVAYRRSWSRSSRCPSAVGVAHHARPQPGRQLVRGMGHTTCCGSAGVARDNAPRMPHETPETRTRTAGCGTGKIRRSLSDSLVRLFPGVGHDSCRTRDGSGCVLHPGAWAQECLRSLRLPMTAEAHRSLDEVITCPSS